MAQTTAQKLGIVAQTTTLVMGRPLEFARGLIAPIPDGAAITDDAVEANLVILFADEVADVAERASAAWDRMLPSGRTWIAYRKGANRKPATPDGVPGAPVPLHRDTLQAALAGLSMDGVTLISIDDIWSAMRIKQLAS